MTSDDDLAALCDRVERLETALHRIVDDRSVPTEWHAGDYRNIARVALAADPPTEGE